VFDVIHLDSAMPKKLTTAMLPFFVMLSHCSTYDRHDAMLWHLVGSAA
jgi:hypothetical protein